MYFLAGYYLEKYVSISKSRRSAVWLWGGLAAGILASAGSTMMVSRHSERVIEFFWSYHFIGIVPMAVSIYLLVRRHAAYAAILAKPISLLARHVYFIYFVHIMVLTIIQQRLTFFHVPFVTLAFQIVATFIVSLTASIIVQYLQSAVPLPRLRTLSKR